MQNRQANQIRSLQNAQTFLKDHADALGDVVATEPHTVLDESLVAIAEHTSVQNGHVRRAKSAVATQQVMRAALIRDHMAPISRIARLKLGDRAELVSLTLPKNVPGYERLAALAQGMALAAEPWADVFIKAGLKPDFIQSLRNTANAMIAAANARSSSKATVRTATSALGSKLAHARKSVNVLDAYVRSALVSSNPDLLEGWKLTKRIPQTGGSGTPAPAATQSPAPAPAESQSPTPASAPAAAA